MRGHAALSRRGVDVDPPRIPLSNPAYPLPSTETVHPPLSTKGFTMSVISDVPVEDVLPEPEVRRRPRGLGIALAVIGGAQLMIVLDGTIVNIALPAAQRELDLSDTQSQWIVTAYALAFGALLLLGGRIADYWGRKRTYLVGMVGFGAASAFGGFAQSGTELIVARGL